ncbi:MAG: helix-hairpin-helix domain-containing protein [Pseudomonadota bacterium]
MGRFTEDMTNLRDEIDSLRNGREEFIANLKHGMSELKSNVADMQRGFRKDHTRMAGTMKDNLKTFVAETETYVSNLKQEVSDMQDDFRGDHADMTHKLKEKLQTFTGSMKSTVSDLGKQFREEHAASTGKDKAERHLFLLNVKQSIDTLKLQSADFIQGISDDIAGARGVWSQIAPAGEKKAVKAGRPAKMPGEPKRTDTSPKGHVNVEKAAFSVKDQEKTEAVSFPVKEHMKAEKTGSPAQSRIKSEAIELAVKDKDQKVQESSTAQPLKVRQPAKVHPEPDDLTQINGIGPAVSKRLNEAGIVTFAKIASSTIEEIRKALGDMAGPANVEMWITQARKLEK